ALLADALAETGAECRHFTADLANPAEVAALVPDVAARFGRAPDLLVNNAALFAEGDWTALEQEALATMMQVNHHAPVILSKSLILHAELDQRPAIVNIVDQR